MKHNNSYDYVIKTAAACADVAPEDMRALSVRIDGTEFEVNFHTDYMSYIMYIDFGGAVRGFLSEPFDGPFTEPADRLEESRCA